MSKCVYVISYVSIAAYGASIGGVTLFSASGISYYCIVLVSESVNRNSFTAEFFVAYSTVYYVVVATLVYTVGSNVVFNYCFACSVSKCINSDGFTAEFFAAYSTVYYVVVSTVVYTVGSNVVFNNYFAFSVNIDSIDKKKSGIHRRIVIRVSYNTVEEVYAAFDIIDIINKCDSCISGNLCNFCNECINVKVFAKFVCVSSKEIDKVCLVNSVLEEFIFSKVCIEPCREVDIYIAGDCFKTYVGDVARCPYTAGNKSIIRLQTGNLGACNNGYGVTLAVIIHSTAGNVDIRLSQIDNDRTNACAVVNHIAVFVVFNVNNDNFVYACVDGSLVREIRLTVGLEACVDKCKFAVCSIDSIAFKIEYVYDNVLFGVIKYSFKVFNFNLGVAGNDHNGTCDEIADIDLAIECEFNIRKLDIRAVGKIFSSVCNNKLAVFVDTDKLIGDLISSCGIACMCIKVDILKDIASEDVVSIFVVPVKLNFSNRRSYCEQACVDGRIVIGVGYDSNDYVNADIVNLKVICEGENGIFGHFFKNLDNVFNSVGQSVENFARCALCFNSSEDFGKLACKLISKDFGCYTVLSDIGSILSKDFVNPSGKINVYSTVDCAPAVVKNAVCADTCSNDRRIGLNAVYNRTYSDLILGIIRLTGNESFDLISYVNRRFNGKNSDNACIHTDCFKTVEIADEGGNDLIHVNVFKINAIHDTCDDIFDVHDGELIVTHILSVYGNCGINTCVYGFFGAVIELTVRLDTDVVNSGSGIVGNVYTVNEYVKALGLVVEINGDIVGGIAVFILEFNVDVLRLNDNGTNDRDCVVHFVADVVNKRDLNVSAVVKSRGICREVGVTVYVNTDEEVNDKIGCILVKACKELIVVCGSTDINNIELIKGEYEIVLIYVPIKVYLGSRGIDEHIADIVCGFIVCSGGNNAVNVCTHVSRILAAEFDLNVAEVYETGKAFENAGDTVNGFIAAIEFAEETAKRIKEILELAEAQSFAFFAVNVKAESTEDGFKSTVLGKNDLDISAETFNLQIFGKSELGEVETNDDLNERVEDFLLVAVLVSEDNVHIRNLVTVNHVHIGNINGETGFYDGNGNGLFCRFVVFIAGKLDRQLVSGFGNILTFEGVGIRHLDGIDLTVDRIAVRVNKTEHSKNVCVEIIAIGESNVRTADECRFTGVLEGYGCVSRPCHGFICIFNADHLVNGFSTCSVVAEVVCAVVVSRSVNRIVDRLNVSRNCFTAGKSTCSFACRDTSCVCHCFAQGRNSIISFLIRRTICCIMSCLVNIKKTVDSILGEISAYSGFQVNAFFDLRIERQPKLIHIEAEVIDTNRAQESLDGAIKVKRVDRYRVLHSRASKVLERYCVCLVCGFSENGIEDAFIRNNLSEEVIFNNRRILESGNVLKFDLDHVTVLYGNFCGSHEVCTISQGSSGNRSNVRFAYTAFNNGSNRNGNVGIIGIEKVSFGTNSTESQLGCTVNNVGTVAGNNNGECFFCISNAVIVDVSDPFCGEGDILGNGSSEIVYFTVQIPAAEDSLILSGICGLGSNAVDIKDLIFNFCVVEGNSNLFYPFSGEGDVTGNGSSEVICFAVQIPTVKAVAFTGRICGSCNNCSFTLGNDNGNVHDFRAAVGIKVNDPSGSGRISSRVGNAVYRNGCTVDKTGPAGTSVGNITNLILSRDFSRNSNSSAVRQSYDRGLMAFCSLPFPSNIVVVYRPSSRNGHIFCGHSSRNFFIPTDKGVTYLSRISDLFNRCAVFVSNLSFNTVNNPNDIVSFDFVSRNISNSLCYIANYGVPTGKGVTYTNRISRLYNVTCKSSVGIILCRKKNRSIPILELNSIFAYSPSQAGEGNFCLLMILTFVDRNSSGISTVVFFRPLKLAAQKIKKTGQGNNFAVNLNAVVSKIVLKISFRIEGRTIDIDILNGSMGTSINSSNLNRIGHFRILVSSLQGDFIGKLFTKFNIEKTAKNAISFTFVKIDIDVLAVDSLKNRILHTAPTGEQIAVNTNFNTLLRQRPLELGIGNSHFVALARFNGKRTGINVTIVRTPTIINISILPAAGKNRAVIYGYVNVIAGSRSSNNVNLTGFRVISSRNIGSVDHVAIAVGKLYFAVVIDNNLDGFSFIGNAVLVLIKHPNSSQADVAGHLGIKVVFRVSSGDNPFNKGVVCLGGILGRSKLLALINSEFCCTLTTVQIQCCNINPIRGVLCFIGCSAGCSCTITQAFPPLEAIGDFALFGIIDRKVLLNLRSSQDIVMLNGSSFRGIGRVILPGTFTHIPCNGILLPCQSPSVGVASIGVVVIALNSIATSRNIIITITSVCMRTLKTNMPANAIDGGMFFPTRGPVFATRFSNILTRRRMSQRDTFIPVAAGTHIFGRIASIRMRMLRLATSHIGRLHRTFPLGTCRNICRQVCSCTVGRKSITYFVICIRRKQIKVIRRKYTYDHGDREQHGNNFLQSFFHYIIPFLKIKIF